MDDWRVRRVGQLGVLLVAIAAIVPAAAAAHSTRAAGSSGTWTPEPGNSLLVQVKEFLANGGCQQIVAPEQQGIVIQNVTGDVTVNSQTPVPHTGFIALNDNPPVGPNGTVQFTLQLNVALSPSTVISVQNYPQCGVGTGLEQLNLTMAPTSPPKEPPHLDAAAGHIEDAIEFEQKAEHLYTLSRKQSVLDNYLGKALKALSAAAGDLHAAVVDGEISAHENVVINGYLAGAPHEDRGAEAAAAGVEKKRGDRLKKITFLLAYADKDKSEALARVRRDGGQT